MKKFMALLLVAVMVLAMAACGAPAEEANKDDGTWIIGNWSVGNIKQIFNADGTGTVTMGNGIEMAADWTFKNGKYIIGYPMGENEATVTMNEDGTLVLHYNGTDYTKAN